MADEDDDASRDDETPREEVEAAQTGETPGEAHREGEFRDLADKLDTVLARLDAITGFLTKRTVEEPVDDADDDADDAEPRLRSLDEIQFTD